MRQDVRDNRLRAEFQRLYEMQAGCPRLTLEPLGSPVAPEGYRITYHVKGITALNGTQPVFGEHHTIRIGLGPTFPAGRPDVRTETMIWHPNIQYGAGGLVCINDWTPLRKLDEVVEQIYDLIRYDPQVTNENHPLNPAASAWYVEYRRHHRADFPLDGAKLREGGPCVTIHEPEPPLPHDAIRFPDETPSSGLAISFADEPSPASSTDDGPIVIGGSCDETPPAEPDVLIID